MTPTSALLQTTQLNLTIGAAAFLITTVHIVFTFPLFSYMIMRQNYPSQRLLMISFLSGFATYSLWLSYIWPFKNLFMITSLSLFALSYLIFLIQTILQRNKTKPKRYDPG
jgi:hypothetical protein